MKKITFLFLCLFLSYFSIAQDSWDVGLEFQAYPTGILPGARIEKNFSERHAVHLRIGTNIFDHRQLGKHYTEEGQGFGFTVGYKRYFSENHERFFLGLRNDVWFNEVKWGKETLPKPPLQMNGITKITVIQPTLEGGYTFVKKHFFLTPTFAFGFEINTKTDGEATGEGAIILLGLGTGYRF